MADVYYILDDGEEKGPYTFDELTGMMLDVHTRILSPTDGWQDACDLPELYEYFEAQGVNFPTEDNLSSYWWRLLAYLIDFILLSIISGFVLSILITSGVVAMDISSYESIAKMPPAELLEVQMLFNLFIVLYNSICEASPMKGSLGKKISGLVVVDADGLALKFPKALLRSFARVFSVFFYGFGTFSIFWSQYKQAMHDFLAKSYVIKK